ncbi:unnamed protein product [Litomosoides sigmodontis]|uniref:PDZ domain-containing protein n=1 Tax=Litomosoides sigmodontis TaxID=42156 RepID=A0A3P6TZM2_LITSI|nr:unnamed protein product [Litomosoides sigmodontis]
MFNWSLSISSATLKSVKSLTPSTSSSFSRAFRENITRSQFYHSLTSLDKTKLWIFALKSFKKVLDAVSVDQKVITNPHSNRWRRTVVVNRNNDEPFGFTIQTYLLKRKCDDVPSKLTYVDYVQLDSPASDAGIRAGDVIVSINGHVVTAMSHAELVKLIGSCHQMRMVVIFQNIRQRVELVARAIKLRKILNDKLYQLNLIDIEEQRILNRAYLRSLSPSKKHSLTNSLSSTGTSSISSASSAPSSISRIANGAERSIIRIPTTVSLTHEATEISRYPLRRPTVGKSNFVEISSSKQSMNLRTNPSNSNAANGGTKLMQVQRICCNESDLEHFDRMSSSSCDVGRTADSFDCFSNSYDSDTGNSYIIVENDTANDSDSGDDSHAAISDNNEFNIFNSVVLPNSIMLTTTSTPIPISESVFDSTAFNHVIMLDDDVMSTEDDGDNDKIRILKL